MGWIYYLLNKYDVAVDYLTKAWKVRKNSAEVADHLGDVYVKLGKNGDAADIWQEALKLEPENEKVRTKLEEIKNQ